VKAQTTKNIYGCKRKLDSTVESVDIANNDWIVQIATAKSNEPSTVNTDEASRRKQKNV